MITGRRPEDIDNSLSVSQPGPNSKSNSPNNNDAEVTIIDTRVQRPMVVRTIERVSPVHPDVLPWTLSRIDISKILEIFNRKFNLRPPSLLFQLPLKMNALLTGPGKISYGRTSIQLWRYGMNLLLLNLKLQSQGPTSSLSP
jgi:hypothetical protein